MPTASQSPVQRLKEEVLQVLRDQDSRLVVEKNYEEEDAISAYAYFKGAPRKGSTISLEDMGGGRAHLDVLVRGSTVFQDEVFADARSMTVVLEKICSGMGIDFPLEGVIEFEIDLLEAYQRLDGTEMEEHDYYLMCSQKSPREAAEAAVSLANGTGGIVRLNHRGMCVSVFPGHAPGKVQAMLTPVFAT